jgi:hypothetical protein
LACLNYVQSVCLKGFLNEGKTKFVTFLLHICETCWCSCAYYI